MQKQSTVTQIHAVPEEEQGPLVRQPAPAAKLVGGHSLGMRSGTDECCKLAV